MVLKWIHGLHLILVDLDECGNSVLHRYACGEMGSVDEGVWLDGALMHVKNKDGDTALHIAAKQGRIEICRWLLQHGANPLERNNKNRTPRSQIKVINSISN